MPTTVPQVAAADPAIDPVADADDESGPLDDLSSSIGLLRPSTSRRLRLPDRSALRAVVVIALAGALIAGWMWWQGRPRPVVVAPSALAEGMPLPSAGASGGAVPLAGEVVVHVTGAVRHPGLVRLPAGARVNDAILAVGGARSEKALTSVNLARILVDGEQIVVGAPNSGAGAGSTGESAAGGIDLNRASASDLEALPGVGPVLAQRIVDWRTANGPFRSVDELGEVSGIGDAVLAQIRTSARV
ncbi:MAG: ComEA family DNA-binding protein [Actinomycetales bacterium]|nr:ComEA family DNA-binding protein [Actinomycetales bacterium]